MLKIKYTNQFKKDYKLIKKRGYNIDKLREVISLLANEEKISDKYKEHYLVGNYKRL